MVGGNGNDGAAAAITQSTITIFLVERGEPDEDPAACPGEAAPATGPRCSSISGLGWTALGCKEKELPRREAAFAGAKPPAPSAKCVS